MNEPTLNRAGHPMDDLALVLAVGRLCRHRGQWPTTATGEPAWRRWHDRIQADTDLALYLATVRDWDSARRATRTASETRKAIREWRTKGADIRAMLEAEDALSDMDADDGEGDVDCVPEGFGGVSP